MNTFNLPDVGEGLTEAEVVSWKVKPGDIVAINDVLVEIETAKSLVELPSPYAGRVIELMVAEGQTVDVGTPLISVGSAAELPAQQAASTTSVPSSGLLDLDPALIDDRMVKLTEPSIEAAPAPLVGSGPKADAVRRRPRTVSSSASSPVPAKTSTTAVPQERPVRALATPPVRKAAKDLGIELAQVPATGARGEVTRQDLLSFQGGQGAKSGDRIERIPVKGVRKATAQAMVQSAFSAPHVSIFVEVDASRTMEFVKRLKASRDFQEVKVSPLLIVAKAVIWAAERNPGVNASWGEQEILVKRFMNLGIAAATPRGLMVPNIKDAQDLSLRELAVALNELTITAREGRTQPAQMQGGTLSITNIGALGLDTGTPILNPGEVAIVAFGTIKQKPWVVDGVVQPRWVTTLGGSFDHRVVDGDLAARFLVDVAAILEEPALLLD